MNQKKISYNFGKKGWGIIGFEIIFLFFMTGMTVDGLNTIVPQIAAFRNWDPNIVLSMSTPASIIALFLVVFWGMFANKFGLKKVTVVTMILAGLDTIWYGNSTSLVTYAVSLVLMVTLISAFSMTCGFSICAQWFPTKKGIVMGITTIGMNLASAIINLILNGLTGLFDITKAISIMGLVIIFVAILVAVFVKATPEEAGCIPDNDPEVAALIYREEEMLKDTPHLSYKDALKNKIVWVMGIAYGCFGMATLGIMSQLISYFSTVRGFTLNQALLTITIAAVIGMIGSWAWGIVDQKIGTQKASVIFGVWYLAGIVFLVIPTNICMYIGIVMLGGAIGGNGNFAPSMASTVFGRKDFVVSYSCMNMILGVTRSCSFALLAVLRMMFNGYTIPYLIFGGISVLGAIMIAAVKVEEAVGAQNIDEEELKEIRKVI